MALSVQRDFDQIRAGLQAWLARRHPDAHELVLSRLDRPTVGNANETLVVEASWSDDAGAGVREGLALRIAPASSQLFREYDLRMQASVQAVANAAGVPTAAPATVEDDTSWLGAPFLVMPLVHGHIPRPKLLDDPWVTSATPAQQATLYDGFVTSMAEIHAIDWQTTDLTDVLRGAQGAVADEVDWWEEFMRWACEGDPPAGLPGAYAWCRANLPDDPPRSLLWGDSRPGNLVFDDDFTVIAVLDWEMASIGAAEFDLGWAWGLESLMRPAFGKYLPGFPAKAEAVERYEALAGRGLVDLDWFEIFALVRALTINTRENRLRVAAGIPSEIDLKNHPLMRAVEDRIERRTRP